MEDLIKQAFLHVEVIGPLVQNGHYDLIGPNGEIILPTVWEKVIEPDWAVTMHMWPMDKAPQRPQMPPQFPPGVIPMPQRPGGGHGHGHGHGMPRPVFGMPFRPASTRPAGGQQIPPPPPGATWAGMPGMQPQIVPGGIPRGMHAGMGPQVVTVGPEKGHGKKPKGGASSGGGMLGWMTGSGGKKSSTKK